ncbi:MAG: hypothetical protein J6S85_04775 [Methanobrevibacter sp.]|nr:hypothetical protein [Methanobrevibacter sp.]
MDSIIKVIADNGISVVCVGYMIYFQLTTMKDVTKTLLKIEENLFLINQKLGIDIKKEKR